MRKITTATTPALKGVTLPTPEQWRAFFATPVAIRAALLEGYHGA